MKCHSCPGEVSPDAWALNLKIISRGAREFLCLACLAKRFKTTEEALLATAERYRNQGCVLFQPPKSH